MYLIQLDGGYFQNTTHSLGSLQFEERSEMKQSGIYFLWGHDDEKGKDIII